MTNTKQAPKPQKPPSNMLGFTTIRISKKAHQELLRRAIAERRTLHAQLDIVLGV